MTIPTFKPRIGKQLIPRSDTTTEANFVRSIRSQMSKIVNNYLGFVDHMEKVNADILYEALEPVFEQSQEEVPVLTGALKASGYLAKRSWRGKQIVEIGYGKGGNPPYAAMVHENLEAYHYAPTKAKYLEDPIIQQADEIQRRIIEGVEKASGV